MDFTEALFLIQLLAFAWIFIYRLRNIAANGALYRIGTGVILFVGSLFTWFLALIIFLNNYLNELYRIIFQFESVLLFFGLVFLIYEGLLEFSYYVGARKAPEQIGGRPGQ